HHRELLFTDEVITASGCKLRLSSSEQWYGVLNPLSEALFVMDERNIVRGVAQRQHRVQHQDEAARLRMFGDMVQRRADELARIENMVAPDTAEHRIQMDYNRRILAGEQVDPLAVTDAAQLRKSRRRSAATTCVGVASETRSPMPQPLCAADDYQLPSSYDAPTFI
ncbi:MAG: hypothetical protein Q4F35_09075, partial [Akkermansia sp.]|nr:hypothetical protein [Akkermansia sp.]